MDQYLRVEIKPSVFLQYYLLGLTGLTLLAVWLAALPLFVQLLLSVFCLWIARKSRCAARTVGVSAVVFREGCWFLEKHGGRADQSEAKPVTFCADSIATSALISLHTKAVGNQCERVLLLPDSSDKHSLRRLRVLLLNKSAHTSPR